MPALTISHVATSPAGVPVIDGSSLKVSQIVREHLFWKLSPEEIQQGHAGLTLGQVHAALSFYFDHRAEIDKQIQVEDELVRSMRAVAGTSPVANRLKAEGLIP